MIISKYIWMTQLLLVLTVLSAPSRCVAFNCTWKQTECAIVTFVSTTGFYAQYSKPAWIESVMFANAMNDETRCGIDGQGTRVRLLRFDIHSNTTQLLHVAAELGKSNNNSDRNHSFCAVLLPEGDMATKVVPVLMHSPLFDHVPLLSGTSGSVGIFRSLTDGQRVSKNLFGVLTPSRQYHSSSLEIIKARGYRRVAIIATSLPLDQSVCNRTSAMAQFNNLEPVSVQVLNYQSPTLQDDIVRALQMADKASPDALISCLSFNCNVMVDAMAAISMNVPIHSTFECVNQAIAQQGVGVSANLEYVMSPAQFDCRASIGDESDLLFPFDIESSTDNYESSSQQFCRSFTHTLAAVAKQDKDFNTTSVPFSSLSGGQLAALYALQAAIQTSSSTHGALVITALQSISLSTFFGTIRFNKYGENFSRPSMLRQLYGTSASTSLLAVPEMSSSISPMPTFSERVFHPIYLDSTIEKIFAALATISTMIFATMVFKIVTSRHRTEIRAATMGVLLAILSGCTVMVWSPLVWSISDTAMTCQLRIFVWAMANHLIVGSILFASQRVWSASRRHETAATAVIRDDGTNNNIHAKPKFRLFQPGIHHIFFVSVAWIVIWMAYDNLHRAQIQNSDLLRPAFNTIDCNGKTTLQFALVATSLGITLLLSTLWRAYQIRNINPVFCPLSGIRHVSILVTLLLISGATLLISELVVLNSYSTARWKFVVRSMLVVLDAWATFGFFISDMLHVPPTIAAAAPHTMTANLSFHTSYAAAAAKLSHVVAYPTTPPKALRRNEWVTCSSSSSSPRICSKRDIPQSQLQQPVEIDTNPQPIFVVPA